MAGNSSFTLKGANPLANAPTRPASPFGMAPKPNPVASALSSVSSGITPNVQRAAPAPATPLKSTTINNVDGSSTTHTYHAPEKTGTNPGMTTGLSEQNVRDNLSKAGYSGLINQRTQTPAPETPAPAPTPTEQLSQGGIYGQLIGQGIGKLQEAGKYTGEAGKLTEAMQRETRDVMGNPYYSGSVKLGQAANIAQQQGSQLQALGAQQQALTQQGQGFLEGAGKVAPIQLPYGTQYVSPTTGLPITGGQAGGSQNPQLQASTYADEVVSGKRSYADAITGMGLYGSVGKQFLDQAIRQANPNFNFAQAQTLGATQGAIKPAYDYAKTALTSLAASVNNLGFSQGTNIPAVNAVGDWISQTFGVNSEQTRNYKTAIAEARSAIQKVLASVQGGTPTDYVAQSMALLPDNATPNDIASAQKTLDTLGAAKVDIYSRPGSSASAPTGTTGTVSAGGFNFVQDAQGNWKPA